MKRFLLMSLAASISLSCYAQKRTLSWDDIRGWNRATAQSISDNGDYIAVESKPWIGDGELLVYGNDGKLIRSFERADNPVFVGENRVVATLNPAKALVDSLTLKKAKKDEMPLDDLLVFDLKKGKEMVVDSLQDFKSSKNNSEWLAYRVGKAKKFVLTNFDGIELTFDDVVEYQFSKERGMAIISRFVKDSISQIITYDLNKRAVASVLELDKSKKGETLAVNYDGKAAYIVVGEDKSGNDNEIYFWDGKKSSQLSISALESDWIVNENSVPYFAESAERLFFGISPKYPVEDSTILESDKPGVDVWVWNDAKLKTEQNVDHDNDIKRAYSVVYDIKSGKTSQIATSELPYSRLFKNGDSDYALVEATKPYQMETMWTGSQRRDVYVKNIVTGEMTELFKGKDVRVSVSPEAKYLYWYMAQDSSWNVYSNVDRKFRKLTTPDKIKVYDASGNVPDLPYHFGSTLWGEDDDTFYIYDEFDIWALDPKGVKEPQRITDGYKTNTTYRVVNFDREKESFESGEKLFLTLFDNTTMESGYATITLGKNGNVEQLVKGKYRYSTPRKAKNSDEIIFTRENFEEFPNLYISNVDLDAKMIKLTDLNPQQSEFRWGSVEQISWVSLDGDTLLGNLYKPEGFDPNKKYPMICNFYERDSKGLFAHKVPEVHRSTIDYHYYTSNGYVIFNPDIKYVDGYPGESCFNSLMPGISKILEMGFVDRNRIGAQGHSWGGYQVAYLATRTDMFAAIESGAPVVNMISAYGGIRWASGLNRAFQYEHGQSRIGASPWETPSRYTENSPIYTMDKVNTPILIMHNDHDGHVPWWQGIEYFVALRRLEKPVWMLNYKGEPHWPLKPANQLDFQTKMSQFFDYYLKGGEMPQWMEEN